ncbi:beta-lactamase/transpeptidase-like protein [Hyaloraphidium curvatum]|nr:beta-lactamase/transpeptidase-like protein [Hyaloraphidium curvatum]
MADDKWLEAAIPAIKSFLRVHVEAEQQPGASIAVALHGRVVFAEAVGFADLSSGEPLTTKHAFRVASHSKSFASAAIAKLRDMSKLNLDTRAGDIVPELHPDVAAATIEQLLSHTAGLIRDGPDAGQWSDLHGFLTKAELLKDLGAKPIIDSSQRFKYSNHGFGLLGLIVESVTGESFKDWTAREIVATFGLKETAPDFAMLPAGTPFARGHTGRQLLGRRLVVPADNSANAMASAGGFCSTPSDLARFFSQLSPTAASSPFSASTRRHLTRRLWKLPLSSGDAFYGLGLSHGSAAGWQHFGHGGAFQGTLSRTMSCPEPGITVSAAVNSLDGKPDELCTGVLSILARCRKGGKAQWEGAEDWAGTWWSIWRAAELVPLAGGKIVVASPAAADPMDEATEIEVDNGAGDVGRIVEAGGYASFGEPARLVRDQDGKVVEMWLGGGRYVREDKMKAELLGKYKAQA